MVPQGQHLMLSPVVCSTVATFLKGLWGPRGPPDPQNNRLPAFKKIMIFMGPQTAATSVSLTKGPLLFRFPLHLSVWVLEGSLAGFFARRHLALELVGKGVHENRSRQRCSERQAAWCRRVENIGQIYIGGCQRRVLAEGGFGFG